MTEYPEKILLAKALKAVGKGKKFEKPHLIVLMGLPGSGKSYTSDYLHKKYGYTILSGENVTFSLFGTEKCSGSGFALAYKILHLLAVDLLQEGYSVVIDGTNLKYVFREQIYNKVNISPAHLIYLMVDDETALSRVNNRGEDYSDAMNIKSSISAETFQDFKSQLEEPKDNEQNVRLISDDKLLNRLDEVISKISSQD